MAKRIKRPAKAADYVGVKVWNRGDTECGKVTATRRCSLAGCTGTRLRVKWPGGRWTWPRTKGLVERADGDLEIG